MSRVTVSRRKDSRTLPAEIHGNAIKINEGAAAVGVEMARSLCPVSNNNQPGHVHLRDTIRVEVDEKTGAASMVAGDPARGVDHALVVEFGGRSTPARPYFTPGEDYAKAEAKQLAEVTKPKG